MLLGARHSFPTFSLEFKSLKQNWHSCPLLLVFIISLLSFSAEQQTGLVVPPWFTPTVFIFYSWIAMNTFHSALTVDFIDGSLDWLVSQKMAPCTYFMGKMAAFLITIICPALVTVLGISLIVPVLNSPIATCLALFLSAIQITALSAALSITPPFQKDDGAKITLPLSLLPLQIPALLLVIHVDQAAEKLPALCILSGLCLFSTAIGLVAFNYSMCAATTRIPF
ncbi:MAG: hypothetical protein NTX76_04775 [Alphaproteobacteria bacterium]|nr:hypothetical protein [Alphaproteobacteria bacterium]